MPLEQRAVVVQAGEGLVKAGAEHRTLRADEFCNRRAPTPVEEEKGGVFTPAGGRFVPPRHPKILELEHGPRRLVNAVNDPGSIANPRLPRINPQPAIR